MPPPLPDRASAHLDALATEHAMVVTEVLRRTGKSLLVAGTAAGRRVVAKILLDDDPFWAAKLRHEIGIYRAFARHAPPIRVPQLIHTDGSRVLVLERLDGHPLDTARYPEDVLHDRDVDAVLSTIIALNSWRGADHVLASVFDYPERIDRYRAHGLLADADTEQLHGLLDSWSGDWEIDHGDPLPSNTVLTNQGGAALLDWEFAGLYLPGFDLALLHTLLARTPYALASIERIVHARGIEVPFVINLAMVLTREIRTHRELTDQPQRAERLELIDTLWERARSQLHTTTRPWRP